MKKKTKIIFEIKDVFNNKVVLWEHTFNRHIAIFHPDISMFIESIKEALTNPLKVIKDKFGAYLFYKELNKEQMILMKTTNKYLLVCSKFANGFYFIASYYLVREIKPGGAIIWPEK